jgi:hypothetical protein
MPQLRFEPILTISLLYADEGKAKIAGIEHGEVGPKPSSGANQRCLGSIRHNQPTQRMPETPAFGAFTAQRLSALFRSAFSRLFVRWLPARSS